MPTGSNTKTAVHRMQPTLGDWVRVSAACARAGDDSLAQSFESIKERSLHNIKWISLDAFWNKQKLQDASQLFPSAYVEILADVKTQHGHHSSSCTQCTTKRRHLTERRRRHRTSAYAQDFAHAKRATPNPPAMSLPKQKDPSLFRRTAQTTSLPLLVLHASAVWSSDSECVEFRKLDRR
jgi:hypothetical protein